MKITLRLREENHVRTFWSKTQDEEIQKLIPFSVASLEDALDLYRKSIDGETLSYGKVIYFEDKYIGDIWCYSIDEKIEKSSMLSIVIFDKRFWKKGVATIAAESFIKDIFQIFQIDRVGAFTYSFNVGSERLLRKLGFEKSETFEEQGIKSFYFELDKIDFVAKLL